MDDKGLLIMLLIMSTAGFSAGAWWEKQQTIEIKNQCEASLPRDQHCKLIAVPEKGE